MLLIMAKQILIDIKGENLSEVAHYLMRYFHYNEEMCSYTDIWMGEMYENKYPLVVKGLWSGIADLKTHKPLNCISWNVFDSFVQKKCLKGL